MKKLYIPYLALAILFLASCGGKGLSISKDEEIKIVQRGTEVISGSVGDVELIIGDITGGGTDVEITSIEEGTTFFKKQMGEGDQGFFEYDGEYYRVKLTQFEEHLIHDDYAFFSFRTVSKELGEAKKDPIDNSEGTPISPDEIREVLNKIKNSGFSFIRNGDVYPDSVMAMHIENKFSINAQDIKTRESFAQKVITKSSITGETYKVINGTDTSNLAQWLGFE